jgi:hypothetical protein
MPAKGKILATMSMLNVMALMGEGNPGALRVLSGLAQRPNGFMRVLDLDDMGMRGDMIWIGFKDFAGEDLDVLDAALRVRDPKLVAVVNREMEQEPGRVDRAVTSGAS